MKFDETTLEQATAFHEFFLSARDIRLRDLAWAMKDSSAIELMDGSFESLVPLWIWARAYAEAGLPAVSEFARPASARFLGQPVDERDRFMFLGELIERYVLEATHLEHPEMEWAIGVRSFPDDWRHHRTTLRTASGSYFGSSGIGRQLWRQANGLQRKPDDSIYFTVMLEHHDGVTVPTGPSILTPFLDQPPLAWDDPARMPPLASDFESDAPVPPAVDAPGEQVAETELIFAAIGTDVEELERAKPLDEIAVAAVLNDLGFESDGESLEERLRASDSQLVHSSGAIMVDVFAHRGRLRALHFELHGSDTDNVAVVAAFTELGHRLRARLGSEDDWTNNR